MNCISYISMKSIGIINSNLYKFPAILNPNNIHCLKSNVPYAYDFIIIRQFFSYDISQLVFFKGFSLRNHANRGINGSNSAIKLNNFHKDGLHRQPNQIVRRQSEGKRFPKRRFFNFCTEDTIARLSIAILSDL